MIDFAACAEEWSRRDERPRKAARSSVSGGRRRKWNTGLEKATTEDCGKQVYAEETQQASIK